MTVRTAQEKAILGIGLATGAGLATCIGASVVFCRPLMEMANNKFLAGGLAFSAGVMLYISLFEIIHKSANGFTVTTDACRETSLVEDCKPGPIPQLYALLSFALGIAIMYLIEIIVHKLVGRCEHFDADLALQDYKGCCESRNLDVDIRHSRQDADEHAVGPSSVELGVPVEPRSLKKESVEFDKPRMISQAQSERLRTTGIITALAIGFHNAPEGIVTFLGAYDDSEALAFELFFAILMHNIPEGLCIAIPVFYSTESPWKGFLWAFLSGLTETVGAFIGLLIIHLAAGDNTDIKSDNPVFGVLFGVVAGVMVMVCFQEILPTSYKYDPNQKITTHAIMAGMLVMGFSIFLFEHAAAC